RWGDVSVGGRWASHELVCVSARWLLTETSFVGGRMVVASTYALARSAGGRSANSLILAGVAVAAFFTAVQTYVNQRNSDSLREVYGWILGRLLTAGWGEVLTVLPYVAVATIVIFGHRRLRSEARRVGKECGTQG